MASRPVYGPGNGIQKNLSTLVLKKPEGEPPKAGDAVPQGGRVREGAARPRTGGSATPPRTRLALGAVGGKRALLKFLSYPQNLLLNYRILYRFSYR